MIMLRALPTQGRDDFGFWLAYVAGAGVVITDGSLFAGRAAIGRQSSGPRSSP